jgi:hypothetical protein
MEVKLNNKEKVVLFLKDEWEYPVKFKVTNDLEQKIETTRIQIEKGELFFVRNMADYYWKLKTLEQFTDEEKSRPYHHPDFYANSSENS